MVGLWWCAYAFNICTCTHWHSHSFFCALSLFCSLSYSLVLPLPFVLITFGNCWCLRALICDMVAMANICSLKMAYVSHSLFLSFALSLSHCLFHFLSLPLAWIQCRLHISLYIPRVLCYPLTLSHMQFVWSDTSVSVTKYTQLHTNNEMKSCCWCFFFWFEHMSWYCCCRFL